jgi:hypothetical protein
VKKSYPYLLTDAVHEQCADSAPKKIANSPFRFGRQLLECVSGNRARLDIRDEATGWKR